MVDTMQTKTIDNSQDVIDSRDIIARIEELEGERDGFEGFTVPETQDPDDVPDEMRAAEWAKANEEDAAELKALLSLQDDAEGYAPDWKDGATLIRDSYMQDYAQETAEDCGMIQKDATWPNDCIDWEEATRQFKQDYTQVDFDGVEYWIR